MIWHYFPIGMRFPVKDFSDETKRECWRIALSAIFASDARGTGLYEACEPFDPGTQGMVYTCIVCYVGIKQSRAAGKTLHSLDALQARLCLHQPLVQANYLEGFGPYPVLADIDAAGGIHVHENGAAFIPQEPVAPMQPSGGWTLLLAQDPTNIGADAERLICVLGAAAADQGFRVRKMTVADGGTGTVRALIAGTNGRFETVACEDVNGDRRNMTIGVMPGPIAVLETAEAIGCSLQNEHTPPAPERSCRSVGMLIRKALDLGYRELWIGLGDSLTEDFGLGALYALGVRFIDEEGLPVEPRPETFDRIVKVDREELDPRVLQSRITLLYASSTPLFGAESTFFGSGSESAASTDQRDAQEARMKRLAALLGGDPNAPGSGAAGGLGYALAAVGGKLLSGVDCIFDRIGLSFAMREADFVITGTRCIGSNGLPSGTAAAAVLERLSEAGRPGCLLVGESDSGTGRILKDYPNLKGVVTCPFGEETLLAGIADTFGRSVLPLIGKDVANTHNP